MHPHRRPELRAYLEASFAKLAKTGMCARGRHPAGRWRTDPDAAQRDARSAGQRQHDAFKTVVRAMLAPGIWGSIVGLPVVGGGTASCRIWKMLSGKRSGWWRGPVVGLRVHRWSPVAGVCCRCMT